MTGIFHKNKKPAGEILGRAVKRGSGKLFIPITTFPRRSERTAKPKKVFENHPHAEKSAGIPIFPQGVFK